MPTDPLPGLWERILEALNAKNAPEVARKLHKTKQSVYEWRDGKSPGLDTLIMIAETGNVSLDWLILGREQKKANEAHGKEVQLSGLTPEVRAQIRREVIEVLGTLLLSNRDRDFVDTLVTDLEQSMKRKLKT
jgi:transcriptional regulator with XRE-family HTH domain